MHVVGLKVKLSLDEFGYVSRCCPSYVQVTRMPRLGYIVFRMAVWQAAVWPAAPTTPRAPGQMDMDPEPRMCRSHVHMLA